MGTTVEITLTDDGRYLVGIEEGEADESSGADDMDDQQEAGSLDEALSMAKHLLSNPPPDSDEASSGPDGDDTGAGMGQASSGAPSSAPNASSAASPSSANDPASAGAAGGGSQSASDIWNELAAQNQPAH